MTLQEEIDLAIELGFDAMFVFNAKIEAIMTNYKWHEPYQTPGEILRLMKAKKRELGKHKELLWEMLVRDIKLDWLLYEPITLLTEEIEKLKKKIYYLENRHKMPERKEYNIARIKEIPMNTLTEILPSGFFVHNPFRNEKSPSNSLHWDKRINRYYDFGTGEHGDVIDLYMALNKVDLSTALKELS